MRWTDVERFSAVTLTTNGFRLKFRNYTLVNLGRYSKGCPLFELRFSLYHNQKNEMKIKFGRREFVIFGPRVVTEYSVEPNPVEFQGRVRTTEGWVEFRIFSGIRSKYHAQKKGYQDDAQVWIPMCDGPEYPWLKPTPILGDVADYNTSKSTNQLLDRFYQRAYERWWCDQTFRAGKPASVLA